MSDTHIPIVLQGMRDGRITPDEADRYLRERCGTTLAQALARQESRGDTARRSRTAVLASIVGILIIVGAFMVYRFDDPTGFASYSIPGGEPNHDVPVPYNVTSLRINGALQGEGAASVYFDTDGRRLLVGTIRSDDGTPRTDKAGYAIGETITVQNAPEGATYYFDDGSTSLAVTPPFAAASPGTLLVISIIDGEPVTHRLPIVIGDAVRTTSFRELCVETCDLSPSTGTLIIEHDEGAALVIDEALITVEEPNRAPELAVAFAPVTVDAPISVALDGHFIDADNDALSYSVGSSDLVDAAVSGNTLTLTPKAAGTGTITIYASDLAELVQAEMPLHVTTPVVAENTSNTTETNTTTEGPPTVIDTTTDTTVNATPELNATPTIDTPIVAPADPCADPNPNLRPTYCFAGNEEAVFEEVVAPLRDKELRTVGRMTRYGNLVVRGVLREMSSGTPAATDFSVGTMTTADFRETYTPTAWIDSDSGDLHLRGTAHQELPTVVPPQYGSYIIQNTNGLVLGYIDRQTGDLYLRGSVVQLGKVE